MNTQLKEIIPIDLKISINVTATRVGDIVKFTQGEIPVLNAFFDLTDKEGTILEKNANRIVVKLKDKEQFLYEWDNCIYIELNDLYETDNEIKVFLLGFIPQCNPSIELLKYKQFFLVDWDNHTSQKITDPENYFLNNGFANYLKTLSELAIGQRKNFEGVDVERIK